MSNTQDIHPNKHTFQFKGFTYLCADEEQQEHDFSALNEEWIENADCTEDSPETSDLPDLADHALVLVFRPYKARWIQPIAVFAAKNAASGSQLYKIALKAMILLEEANARVLTTAAGKTVKYSQLLDMFMHDQNRGSTGLSAVPKLKPVHFKPNSF
ncbi:hypothetical protein DAPPUDRAFT_264319 [Daphnia pulex]|uniref:Transposable element P transposase-like RNase H domain-containing protein n=1 Tax=Daphnia pulex TaxID=6669 RepID=E9HRC0_DAPPU|nr:hypothetical protein DAPPUDRAFT_264319 [Daphnia pulex]|eukprot:EFX65674.1 hypothetical protein DAPPUDRAFT_264319 [Daphnia pulex]